MMPGKTICKEVAILALNYVDSHGHILKHVKVASELFGISVRSVWMLIRRRKIAGSIGKSYFCLIHNTKY
jgi:hypothetical protein